MSNTPYPNLSVKLFNDLHLVNPVMIASGTFGSDGYGAEFPSDIDMSALGAVVLKTYTRHPKSGNKEPWFYQRGDIVLNSNGLKNDGIESLSSDYIANLVNQGCKVIVSVWGEDILGFSKGMAQAIRRLEGISAVEINVSCPNVEFYIDEEVIHTALYEVKDTCDLPVIVKLPPNYPDIVSLAYEAIELGADALTVSNTIPAMDIDVEARKPVLDNVTGGLSGASLLPVSLSLVHRLARAVELPIIGVGGIKTGEDALKYILAGATAVQVGSANRSDPYTPLKVIDGIKDYMYNHSVEDVNALRGALQV